MRELSPGRFELQIGNTTKTVVVTLGLRAELLRLMTKAQLDVSQAQRRVYMDGTTAAAIQALVDTKETLVAQDEPDKEALARIDAELNVAYGAALRELEEQQDKLVNEILQQKLVAMETVVADAFALLLTERDDLGKVVTLVTREEILWKPEYAAAQDELMNLLVACVNYITSALKKISAATKAVQDVTTAMAKTE